MNSVSVVSLALAEGGHWRGAHFGLGVQADRVFDRHLGGGVVGVHLLFAVLLQGGLDLGGLHVFRDRHVEDERGVAVQVERQLGQVCQARVGAAGGDLVGIQHAVAVRIRQGGRGAQQVRFDAIGDAIRVVSARSGSLA